MILPLITDKRGRCERYSDPDATFEAVDLDPALLIDFIQFNCVGKCDSLLLCAIFESFTFTIYMALIVILSSSKRVPSPRERLSQIAAAQCIH